VVCWQKRFLLMMSVCRGDCVFIRVMLVSVFRL